MKKLSLLLLVAAVTTYAAGNGLVISDEIIGLADKVVKSAWNKAMEQAGGLLIGSVSEMYRQLQEDGYKKFINEDPAAVDRAAEIFAFLTDKNNENEDVKLAVAAFEAAQSVSEEAEIEVKLQAWQNEYKTFSVALIKLLKQRTPEDLVIHPLTIERILANNGKTFIEEALTEIKAGSLVVLAGFERRKAVMGDEVFKLFCDDHLQNSPAHQAVSAITILETK